MNNQLNKSDLINLFKGVDPLLAKTIPSQKIKQLEKITIKELYIIAESAEPSASLKLEDLLKKSGSKLSEVNVSQINALVESGRLMPELSPDEQKEVNKFEIREEMNHFTRIMGLDKVISELKLLPLSSDEAFAQCKDFSRFLWLVYERRNQKMKAQYKLDNFPGKVTVKTGNGVCVLNQYEGNNVSAVLFSQVPLNKASINEFNGVAETLAKFLSLCGPEIAIPLLDYFLFLTGSELILGIICAQVKSGSNNSTQIKVTATGGSFVAVQTDTGNFINEITTMDAFNNKTNGALGKLSPVIFNTTSFELRSKASRVFLFPPDAGLGNINRNEILKVLNTKDTKGKINPQNNINKLLQKNKNVNIFAILRPGINPFNKNVTAGKINLPENLLRAKKIVIESAHLHADRSASPTQLETVNLRNKLLESLKERGFNGIIEDVLMIDDYHVVNRLDYKNYLTQLKRSGFVPDFIILESSPVIRAISLDIIRRLITVKPESVELKGNNLYLTLANGRVIELVEGFQDKNILGCVLFDAAFSLFKKDIKSLTLSFRGVTDTDILQFYLKEKSPLKRKSFIDKATVPIPNLDELKNNDTPLLNKLEKVESVEVVNVHEIFYQPQQAKVNALLSMIETKAITSAYLNPLANDVLIECSALFG